MEPKYILASTLKKMAANAEESANTPAAGETKELQPPIDLSGDGGVLKEIYQEGEGDCPELNNEIFAHYTGTLLDGTVFDSSRQRGQ